MNTQKTKQKADTTDTIRVAIQGYAGAFHDVAANLFFTESPIKIVETDTFDELVTRIEKGTIADMGLMAIENSLAGSLMYNYELLSQSTLRIAGEIYLRIEQNLMALPGVTIEDLKEVHSHPMAIAQSRNFFKRYPHIRLIETLDTALSAKNIAQNKLQHTGAIASTLAAGLYGLDILAKGIETNKQNYTRFLVLQRKSENRIPKNAKKVSLCFSLPHESGSLHNVLAVLSAYKVNLTKIQSAPIIGKPWEYRFFIDFVVNGHIGYKQAIAAVEPLTKELIVMGVYPSVK